MSLTLSPRIGVVAACVALAALALAGGTVAFVLPQMSDASSLQRTIAAAESVLSAAVPTTPVVEGTSNPASSLFELGVAMPATSDEPGILIDLSALAKASAVTINTLSPSALAAQTGYSVLPISLTLTGTYAEITKFLAQLRHAVVVTGSHLATTGRLFLVNQIQLSPGATSTTSTSSSSSGPSAKHGLATADVLSASLQLEGFVYGTTSPSTTTATTSTSTTTTSG